MESIIETINISSIFAVISAAAAAYIAFRNALFHRKKQFREDYEFIQKLLARFLNKENEMHPLELEAGFLAYLGKPLKVVEIKLLLSPVYKMLGMLGLKNYINARSLLEVNENGFSYKEQYKKKSSRNIRYSLKWTGYLIWSSLTYFPALYSIDIYQKYGINGVVITSSIVVVSGIMTYVYLKEISEFKSAAFLLKEKDSEEERVKNLVYPMTEEIKET